MRHACLFAWMSLMVAMGAGCATKVATRIVPSGRPFVQFKEKAKTREVGLQMVRYRGAKEVVLELRNYRRVQVTETERELKYKETAYRPYHLVTGVVPTLFAALVITIPVYALEAKSNAWGATNYLPGKWKAAGFWYGVAVVLNPALSLDGDPTKLKVRRRPLLGKPIANHEYTVRRGVSGGFSVFAEGEVDRAGEFAGTGQATVPLSSERTGAMDLLVTVDGCPGLQAQRVRLLPTADMTWVSC